MTEIGKVIGTAPSRDARPLEFWIGVAKEQFVQLDDVVAVATLLPDGREVTLYGIVDDVRASYEGAKFDSDVFLVKDGVLPVNISTVAHVAVTRVEDADGREVFVPPLPGQPVHLAEGEVRDKALFFDSMQRRFPAGLGRDGSKIWANLEFLNGDKGAHVNISGVSGVAAKTSYAMFLIYSLLRSGCLGAQQANTKAIVFNVKGEDLFFLDKENARLGDRHRAMYDGLGLQATPFDPDLVGLWAPVKKGDFELSPDTGRRQEGVEPYAWSIREFCKERLLRFLFAEADEETSQLSSVIAAVERHLEYLAGRQQEGEGWLIGDEGERLNQFGDLVDYLSIERLESITKTAAAGTRQAFLRRLEAAGRSVGHLIRHDAGPENWIAWEAKQVNVIGIHNLDARGKRFVVGVVLKRLMEGKEEEGTSEPLVFVVLDELNKYAPREGWSPIKEVVLDIAERGRSLGVILIGAQQTASEVERRVVANCSFRVVGRLDAAEARRDEYGYLSDTARSRSMILKPGSLFLYQPEIPIPLLVQFPLPSWATRPDEVKENEEVPRAFRR